MRMRRIFLADGGSGSGHQWQAKAQGGKLYDRCSRAILADAGLSSCTTLRMSCGRAMLACHKKKWEFVTSSGLITLGEFQLIP